MEDINIFVTSDLTSSERRISPNWSINYLKSRFEPVTGIPPSFQKLTLFTSSINNDSIDIRSSNDDITNIGSFNIAPFCRIHVSDTREESTDLTEIKELENDNDFKRFTITDEEYSKRNDSVRNWKLKNKLGRFDEELKLKLKNQNIEDEKISKNFKIGSRCRLNDKKIINERRGTILYIGKVEEIDGNIWIGVKLDEPLGKNNGSIKGKKYFECKNNYGSFVKPSNIEVGDFPEEDLFESEDEEL